LLIRYLVTRNTAPGGGAARRPVRLRPPPRLVARTRIAGGV